MGLRRYIKKDPNFVNTLSTIAAHKQRGEYYEDQRLTNELQREKLKLEKRKLQKGIKDSERTDKMQKHMFIGQTLNPVLEAIRNNPESAPEIYKQSREIMIEVFGDADEMPETFDADKVKHIAATNNIFYDSLNKNKPLPVTFTNKKTGMETKANLYSTQYHRLSDNPDWDQGEVIGSRDKGTDFSKGYQQWLRTHPGGTRAQFRQSAWLKQDTGLSEEDKRRYDKWDDRADTMSRTVMKLESELSRIPKPEEGEKDIFRDKRQLLKDYKKKLKFYRRKMDKIIPPKEGGEVSLDIPQETIDYWIEKGKSLEEIREAYEKKYGDKAPSIGY